MTALSTSARSTLLTTSNEATSTPGCDKLPQLVRDLGGDLLGARQLGRLERHRAHHRMAAAAVTLADLRDVGAPARQPRVGADRHLGARGAQRYADHVVRLRKQIIGNELVGAVEPVAGRS